MPSDDDPRPPGAELPVGTLTFVLTDIEGSTELWDGDATAMGAALHQHDALIAAAVSSHGGQLVKSKGEGDSTFSVFLDPSAAVSAAEAMRDTTINATWPTPSPIRVRIGVLTGVAELRDGDYYGVAINRAARVRSLAHGGEVLLAASTYALIADSLLRNRVVEDRGEYELRGLQRPERVYALCDGGAAPDATRAPQPRRTRILVLAGVTALAAIGIAAFVVSRHSNGHPRAAAPPPTSTTAAAVFDNKPTVEISSVALVSSPRLVRYDVTGVFSRVHIPPYEIRILARAPADRDTWLWSPPATIKADGKWNAVLDVPTAAGVSTVALQVSAIAILPGPVSGITPHGPPGSPTTVAITLPPSPQELAYEHQLTTRGPQAKGVIAVSTGRSPG